VCQSRSREALASACAFFDFFAQGFGMLDAGLRRDDCGLTDALRIAMLSGSLRSSSAETCLCAGGCLETGEQRIPINQREAARPRHRASSVSSLMGGQDMRCFWRRKSRRCERDTAAAPASKGEDAHTVKRT
jgi:hypothetical protein